MREAFILLLRSDGLTLQQVIGGIPHDVGAVVAYLMIGGFVLMTWLGSRGRAAGKSRGDGPAAGKAERPTSGPSVPPE